MGAAERLGKRRQPSRSPTSELSRLRRGDETRVGAGPTRFPTLPPVSDEQKTKQRWRRREPLTPIAKLAATKTATARKRMKASSRDSVSERSAESLSPVPDHSMKTPTTCDSPETSGSNVSQLAEGGESHRHVDQHEPLDHQRAEQQPLVHHPLRQPIVPEQRPLVDPVRRNEEDEAECVLHRHPRAVREDEAEVEVHLRVPLRGAEVGAAEELEHAVERDARAEEQRRRSRWRAKKMNGSRFIVTTISTIVGPTWPPTST